MVDWVFGSLSSVSLKFVSLSGPAIWPVLASVLLALPLFISSWLYRAIFRYTGIRALITTGRAVAWYGALLLAYVVTLMHLARRPTAPEPEELGSRDPLKPLPAE